MDFPTIQPTTNQLTLELGTEQEEVVTVTIPKDVGVNKADVYLLSDTTNSMRDFLNVVKAEANNIVGASFGDADVAFGVGNYRDLPRWDPPFVHQCDPTTDTSKAAEEIQNWTNGTGVDLPEAQFYALHKLAEAPEGPEIGWRSNSKRIVVWFGDAPGHDPICQAMSGLDVDITEASVQARLVEQGITVIAISFRGSGLDGDPTRGANSNWNECGIGGEVGQASRIAAATGGKHVTDIDADEIVQTIIDLIDATIKDISEVKLVPTADIAPFVGSITPASFTNLPGEEEHVLEFKVVCQGVNPCANQDAMHAGAMDAVADGATIASQSVQVTVPACNPNRLTRFILVNAETNEDIRVIEENDILDLSALPAALNVRVESGDAVNSVNFSMTPHNTNLKGQENQRPFSLFGDTGPNGNNFNAGSFENGTHSINATPFSEILAQGDQGEALSVTFEVING